MLFGSNKQQQKANELLLGEVRSLQGAVSTLHSEIARQKVQIDKLVSNSAAASVPKENSGPKTKAVVSCITNNFIGLGATFIASLMENGKLSPDTHIILLTDPVYAPLSDENRAALLAICGRIKFISPDTSFLNDDLVKRWENGKLVKQGIDAELPNKRSVYIKLCALRLVEFDSILWLDSDLFIVRTVSELFDLPASLAMVRGGTPHHHYGVHHGSHKMGFNSGVMLIKKPYIGEKSFQQAVSLLRAKQHTEKQDQSLLNAQWLKEPRTYLPHHYNWKLGLIKTDEEWDHAFEHARVLHFDGPCKWKLKEDSRSNKTTVAFHEMREKYNIPMVMEP